MASSYSIGAGGYATRPFLSAIILPTVTAALATAQWGGRFVSSLNHACLWHVGMAATVQAVCSFVLAPILERIVEGQISTSFNARDYVYLTSGSLLAGGIIYTIGFAAVKAGLISTALTLPAVASLVVIPAVIEGVSLFFAGRCLRCLN